MNVVKCKHYFCTFAVLWVLKCTPNLGLSVTMHFHFSVILFCEWPLLAELLTFCIAGLLAATRWSHPFRCREIANDPEQCKNGDVSSSIDLLWITVWSIFSRSILFAAPKAFSSWNSSVDPENETKGAKLSKAPLKGGNKFWLIFLAPIRNDWHECRHWSET